MPLDTRVAEMESLARLRDKIRWGKEPNNPSLIAFWLAQENGAHEQQWQQGEQAASEQGKASLLWRRQCYENQFTLLLETLVDELVAPHWRCLCLDNIYRPLQALKQISDTTHSEYQIQRLVRELAIQSRYVRHSLRF